MKVWVINVTDELQIDLRDLPTGVVDDLARTYGVVWSQLIDAPRAYLGAAASIVAYVCGAHGIDPPPLGTARDVMAALGMFQLVTVHDNEAQPAMSAPVAWSATDN